MPLITVTFGNESIGGLIVDQAALFSSFTGRLQYVLEIRYDEVVIVLDVQGQDVLAHFFSLALLKTCL